MNILFLLLFWSLWFLNFSTRTVLSPLLPIFEKELHISHALAGSIFLFLAVGYTSSLLVSNWVTPRVGFKKSVAIGFIVLIAALLFLMHLLDVYWMVMPSFHRTGPQFSWLDVSAPLGIGAIWLWFVLWRLKAAALLPQHDPGLQYAFRYGP